MKPIANVSVRSEGPNYRHAIETGHGHTLVADEPVEGGGNTGPAPYEFYLSGLGACTAITLRMYAERKNWDLGRLSVELKLSKDHEGRAYIERILRADGKLDDNQWQRLLEIAEKTPVTKTVREGAAITTSRG
jgi:putative redox protein